MKFHQNIWKGFQLTKRTRVHSRNGYLQYLLCLKGRNSKSRLSRVTFSCVLHVVSWCYTFVRSFIKISGTVFNLQSGHEYMVEVAMFNVQITITPKVSKSELRFMCSARCLIVRYICVKFRKNISNGFQLT